MGTNAVTTPEECEVDLFGDGGGGRRGLVDFLKEQPYGRAEWWPQPGAQRVSLWQAVPQAPTARFEPRPWEQFGKEQEFEELALSFFLTVVGNLDDLSAVPGKLAPDLTQLEDAVETVLVPKLGEELGTLLARFAAAVAKGVEEAAIDVTKLFAPLLRAQLPEVFAKVLQLVLPVDGKDGPQQFQDYAWRGLPMDNQASDVLIPTEFSEAWIPLPYAVRAMNVLKDWFAAPGEHEALARTGTLAWEVYGAKPTQLWMACSHTDGADEWKDGVVRIDAYWFSNNPGDPAKDFYPAYWNLLRDAEIPFRLHWGKFQPAYAPGDRHWVDFFRAQYPRWDDFLALRRQKDPNNIFLNDYWRARFGLWDEPGPEPR